MYMSLSFLPLILWQCPMICAMWFINGIIVHVQYQLWGNSNILHCIVIDPMSVNSTCTCILEIVV